MNTEPYMLDDPFLASLGKMADLCGFKFVSWDDRGEFPPGLVVTRITGPMMPANGLPFPVPEHRKEVWSERWRAVLAASFVAGMTKANDLEGKANATARALWAHNLARLIVSEVRSPGADDEKVIITALLIRGEMPAGSTSASTDARPSGGPKA